MNKVKVVYFGFDKAQFRVATKHLGRGDTVRSDYNVGGSRVATSTKLCDVGEFNASGRTQQAGPR